MLQIITETTAQKSCLYDIYQRHNQRAQDNDAGALSLYKKINEVTNTPGNKMANTLCDCSSGKTGLLKCLLVCIKSRTESHQCPLSDVITDCQETANLSSPQDYYKNLYDNKNIRRTGSVIVTETPDKITHKQSVENIIKEKSCPAATSNDEYRHEGQRNIYYDTVARNIYFPLGAEIYKKLDKFCQSGIKNIVSSAFNSDLNTRYNLLHNIIDKIDEYKMHQAALRDKNINMKNLSLEEHAEEIITKRKLIILYLAAESIINQSSDSYFHMIAMGNIKNYSMQDLMAKEKDILRYVSKHEAMKEY